MKTEFGTAVQFKPARVAVTLACVAAVAAMLIGALPKGVAAGNGVEGAMRPTVMQPSPVNEPATRPALLVEEPGKARGKAVCAECGIIESVQRIETPMQFTGWCDATEIARTQNSGKAFGRDFRADRESLRETVTMALAANRSTTKDAVTTRHRIVVRLRNGSRHVFEEATPRMVNVGDRMVVIAGAPANRMVAEVHNGNPS